MAENSKITDCPIQQKGDPAKPGAVVRRHFLTAFGGAEIPPEDKSSGRLRSIAWLGAGARHTSRLTTAVSRQGRVLWCVGSVGGTNPAPKQMKPADAAIVVLSAAISCCAVARTTAGDRPRASSR